MVKAAIRVQQAKKYFQKTSFLFEIPAAKEPYIVRAMNKWFIIGKNYSRFKIVIGDNIWQMGK